MLLPWRRLKRNGCVARLMEFGFDEASANLAADAGGGDAERAATMLLDGQECCGQAPVDVERLAPF